jgi:hypothetical protein
MGGPFVEQLPSGWLDFAREVPPQPDALLVSEELDAEAVAVETPRGIWSHSDLVERALGVADDLGLSPGGRLLTDANPGAGDGLLPALVAPLVVGGSVILVTGADAATREAIASQEAATATHWAQRGP